MASHTIDLSDFQLTAAKAAEKCISSPQQIDEVDSTTQRIKRHRAADFNKEFTEGTMLIIASTPPRPTEVFLCKGPHVFLSALNKLAIAIPKFDEDGDEYFIDFDAIFVRNTKKPKGEDWKSWIYPTKPKIMTKKDFQEALSVFQTIIGCNCLKKLL